LDHYNFIWIIVSLLLSAIFSGIEIAFISVDKLQLEIQAKNIRIAGRILSHFVKMPGRFMGLILVGNTAALVVFSMLMTDVFNPLLAGAFPILSDSQTGLFLIQTTLTTIIVLVTAEFLPKSTFIINPIAMLRIFSFPLMVLYWVLYVPVLFVVYLSKFMLTAVFGLDYSEEKVVFGLTDLNNYVKNLTEGVKKDTTVEVDTKILTNALEFKTVKVRDCMVPRTEISAIDLKDGIEELALEFTRSGHSKVLVYKETVDEVIGYCHVLEMLKKPKAIDDVLVPVIIVPETFSAHELMVRFNLERKSLALVVDEYGGTSGVVTMEDIIEEIFGEIQDEHDDDEFTEVKIDTNTYILSARLEVDYLNDKYNWKLPVGEYETLSGLVYSIVEDIPKEGEELIIGNYHLSIKTIHETGIGTVKLVVK